MVHSTHSTGAAENADGNTTEHSSCLRYCICIMHKARNASECMINQTKSWDRRFRLRWRNQFYLSIASKSTQPTQTQQW